MKHKSIPTLVLGILLGAVAGGGFSGGFAQAQQANGETNPQCPRVVTEVVQPPPAGSSAAPAGASSQTGSRPVR